MRPILKEVFKNYRKKNVFVVGGGASIKPEYLEFLRDKTTVAINSAFKFVPNVDMIYWTDTVWPCDNQNELNKINCYKFHARTSAENHIENDLRGTFGETILKLHNGMGYSEDINAVYGNNSGAQVLNFLANLKVKRIYLLGFDMNSNNGKTHFHDEYRLDMRREKIYRELFIPSITSIKPLLEQNNIEVVNCSPTSSLLCFKRVSFENVMENYSD